MTSISAIQNLPDQQNQEPSAMHSWAVVIAHTLEHAGVDSQALFHEAGVEYKQAVNPYMRVPTAKMNKLFELSVLATKNPGFGLTMVEFIHPTTFHALGYSLFASSTLEDFFERLVRFFRIASDNCLHHIEESQTEYKLRIELLVPNLSHETQDGWTATLVKFIRAIYRPGFNPVRIKLPRPELPLAVREKYQRYFRCPIEFDADEWAVYYDRDEVNVPLPGGNSELALANDKVAMDYLAQLEKSDLVTSVRSLIVQQLPSGNCSKEWVAANLHMSPRNLQRKLDLQKTNYQDILDQTRKGLAKKYIESKHTSISEITYLLGFSDTSNFSRAFKRWLDCTPSQYRARATQDNT